MNSAIARIGYVFLLLLIVGPLQNVHAQVLKNETKITIDKDGVKTTQTNVRVRINNKQSNWLSHIEVRHDPKQTFSFNYAQIIDSNGKVVRKLKKKELITRNDLSYQAFYQDDLITEFDLYWNQYPYNIEYSYSIEEEEYLYLALWTPLYNTNVTTIEGLLEVNLPSDFSVRVNSFENFIFEEIEIEEKRTLSWRSKMVKNEPKDEIYSPPIETLIPMVKIVPSEFKYGVLGKSDSWSSFGTWLDHLNFGTDQLTLKEKWNIEKLIDGISNRNEIIKAIYYYLQDQTKYVNVAIDVGGLKSYPASYVCENKYGDCKALTTYMKAMLKTVGIESFYTIIKAGESNSEIDINLPSQQFNHVILMVPSEMDTLWLENTSSSLPFNYLGTFTQNRYALIINGEKSQLVKTPELSIHDVLLERNYTFQVADNNDIQIDLDLTLRGKEFEDFRYFLAEKDESRQNKEVIKHSGVNDFKVSDWEILDFNRDSIFSRINVNGMST